MVVELPLNCLLKGVIGYSNPHKMDFEITKKILADLVNSEKNHAMPGHLCQGQISKNKILIHYIAPCNSLNIIGGNGYF
jgi:hypothetical protein